jgi:hypothetical protein
MKIAILILGELRIPDFKNLYNSIKNYDIYISTYTEDYNIAKKLTDNVITTDRKDNLIFNKKTIPYPNIYQWWHLNKLLIDYKKELQNYDILLKTRSDCYFIKPLTDEDFLNIDMSFFYMNSDHSFYSSVNIFYNLFENYYDDILNKYLDKGDKYFDINYNNLIQSYKNIQIVDNYKQEITKKRYRHIRQDIHQGLRELVYPKHVFSQKNDILVKNIEEKLNKNIDIDNKEYCNFFRSGNPNFGSEKYIFLNAVNKVIIKKFNLPTIGVI